MLQRKLTAVFKGSRLAARVGISPGQRCSVGIGQGHRKGKLPLLLAALTRNCFLDLEASGRNGVGDHRSPVLRRYSAGIADHLLLLNTILAAGDGKILPSIGPVVRLAQRYRGIVIGLSILIQIYHDLRGTESQCIILVFPYLFDGKGSGLGLCCIVEPNLGIVLRAGHHTAHHIAAFGLDHVHLNGKYAGILDIVAQFLHLIIVGAGFPIFYGAVLDLAAAIIGLSLRISVRASQRLPLCVHSGQLELELSVFCAELIVYILPRLRREFRYLFRVNGAVLAMHRHLVNTRANGFLHLFALDQQVCIVGQAVNGRQALGGKGDRKVGMLCRILHLNAQELSLHLGHKWDQFSRSGFQRYTALHQLQDRVERIGNGCLRKLAQFFCGKFLREIYLDLPLKQRSSGIGSTGRHHASLFKGLLHFHHCRAGDPAAVSVIASCPEVVHQIDSPLCAAVFQILISIYSGGIPHLYSRIGRYCGQRQQEAVDPGCSQLEFASVRRSKGRALRQLIRRVGLRGSLRVCDSDLQRINGHRAFHCGILR